MAADIVLEFGPPSEMLNFPVAAKANLAQDLGALGRIEQGNALRTEVVSRTSARVGNAHPAVGQFANPDLRANCDIDPMPL